MKRRIISILLSLAIIFSMSACAGSKSPKETTNSSDTINVKIDEPIFFYYPLGNLEKKSTEEAKTINPWSIEDCFPYYDLEKIKSLDVELVKILVQDMISASKTENLSPSDMDNMGWMFHHIWYQCDEYDKETLRIEFCEVFENIYNRAINIGVPLDFLISWLDTPVCEVAIKYISSDNFKEPHNIWGRAILKLSEEELLQFLKAFVTNPLMETNATIARTILCLTDNDVISKIAWEHLVRLSNSKSVTNLAPLEQTFIIRDIFDDYDLNYESDIVTRKIYSSEYIMQIAENILDNHAFDSEAKYDFFCSDFLANSDLDAQISEIAMSKLRNN